MNTDTSTKPKVTIQMCTYNRAHFIKQAIDSVMSQTFQDWELVILDDCSTDNTSSVVSAYTADSRIKYIQNPENLGITKNRNKSLSLSQGEYVAVLDSDDYWTDNEKLQKQVSFLDTFKDYALVGTNVTVVNEQDKTVSKIIYPPSNFIIKNILLIKNFFCHSSVMYRKNEIIQLGGYDESLPIWEDYDLWLKVGTAHKFTNLQIFATAYRRHEHQSNADKKEISKKAQADIIQKHKKNYNLYLLAFALNKLRNIIR